MNGMLDTRGLDSEGQANVRALLDTLQRKNLRDRAATQVALSAPRLK